MTNTVSDTVTDEYLDACVQVESGGNPRAKASTSSALGLGQFLNATWLNTVKRHAPEIAANKTQSQILALRLDPSFSIEMLGRFTEDNQKVVGMGCTDGDLYLAHFLGAGDAKKIYRAPAIANVIKTLGITGPGVARANPTVVKPSTTCAQLRAWAAKRMKESAGHGWIKKYYHPHPAVGLVAEPLARTDLPAGFSGDVLLYDMQVQLRAMKYASSQLDGKWGGKTSGDISGFLNDYSHGAMPAPTSLDQFHAVRDQLQLLVNRAEEENFTRPVTEAREQMDPATVAAVAPAVVPAKKGLWATITGFIVMFFSAIWDTVSNYGLAVWNFFTNNKDNIPVAATDPSTLTTWFHAVPAGVWLFLVAALLGFIGLKSWQSVRKINTQVSTGEL
jgi:hypothetical protein